MTRDNFLQISRFLLVGSLVTLIDSIIYAFCLFLDLPIPLSKALSFIGAVCVAFFMHSRWTFALKKTSVYQLVLFFGLYLVNLPLNVISNSLFLELVGISVWGLVFAFLSATTLCAITNFTGQKYIVFRGSLKGPAETQPLPDSAKTHF